MIHDPLIPALPGLLSILAIFTVGVASPGPATLTILGTAMSEGRSSAIVLSLGVVTGSFFWGLVAAFGFVAALQASVVLFTAMKLAGSIYLFYLALRSWWSALAGSRMTQLRSVTAGNKRRNYTRGLLMHLANPKAPLVWMATLSVGLGEAVSLPSVVSVVLLCEVIAILTFVGYSFVFSTQAASRMFMSIRRQFDAILGLLFGAAAIKLWI